MFCFPIYRKHYQEYLAKLINDNDLDPVELMDKDKIMIVLHRGFKEAPKQEKKESDEAYTERLRKVGLCNSNQ